MTRILLAALLSLVLAPRPAFPAETPLFPFALAGGAPENATNISGWLEKPAGKHGFVRAENGQLVTDAGPIRFWATNLCFESCFPTHADAERLAARLARFGVNCVRMHHMDNRHIWGNSPDKTTIDPAQLEKLDYLVHQLKEHGVYTNLNLHVSRWLDDKEGFPHRDQRPNYDKGLDNFEPRMIELQKKYARDLLTHVNPYTKTAYANEPAVAFVEINNENALWANWAGGDLDDLPEPYAVTFRGLWNGWLAKKYGSTEKLRQAWNVGRKELGAELLTSGDFSQPDLKPWNLERDDQTDVDVSVTSAGPQGARALKLIVRRLGTVEWHPQLSQSGLAFKQGEPYTFTFQVKSDAERQMSVNAMMAHEPWERLGLSANFKIGPEWQTQRFTFIATEDDPNARITFSSFQPGTFELAAVSLRPGGIVGIEADQQLENQSVPIIRHGQINVTEIARRDWVDFLCQTERDYWLGMYRLLKEELGVKPLVSGTQLSYSPMHIQAQLDYIDAHSYWHHPSFPGRPWDARDWYVTNAALVNSPEGSLAGLAERQVAGKAYTVSEYNHPAPNQYAAEGFPMIAAFGAFQGWDGIFSFTWSHSSDFEPGKITSFFDIKGDTSRLAHMPACAALFLRGDAAPAKEVVRVGVSAAAEREKLFESLSAWEITADNFGADRRVSLLHALAMDPQGTAGRPAAPPREASRFVSDTAQMCWDVSEKDAGYFLVNTPRTKVFTGFVRGRSFKLGDAALRIGPTRLDWATITLTALDGPSLAAPGRVLIAATGLVENQGMKLEKLGANRITVGNQWGEAPMACEGISAQILLPIDAARATLYPLDESGNRRAAVPLTAQGGKTLVTLDPKHKTVWYELEIRP